MPHTLALHWRYAWLVTASFLAGVINAMAGGGSFLSFPAMLGMGVAPIQANATNTVALWPGQLTSLARLQADVRGICFRWCCSPRCWVVCVAQRLCFTPGRPSSFT